MQSLNSDQLRKLLKKHTRKMNWLAEQNDLIVATLKQRGLQAIDPAGDDISIHTMRLDKPQSEPKPLTADDLMAGGWWCKDTGEDALKAFLLAGLKDKEYEPWDGSFYACFLNEIGSNLLNRGFSHHTEELKEIHRIGNNFYWGAP